MAVQLVGGQLIDSIITESKLANGSVAFAKLKTSDVTTNLSVSAGASELATAAAIQAAINAAIPDTFQGGNGIEIDASGNPDVINVDLASNPGLQFTSNKLDLKVKAESGGSITKDADGIYIADGAIANDKLANNTISGIALGSNLANLSAGNGLQMTAYNGGTAVSDLTVKLDGSTLAKGPDGLKVQNGGIGSGQIADGAVTKQKVSFAPQLDMPTISNGQLSYNLTEQVPAGWETGVAVYRNGVLLKQVESSPSDLDEYTASQSGSNTVVTFGAQPSTTDLYVIRYWA
tara:strand:+ start:22912 stop:23781 length:870 start_codon:yes stop_codon:yes gene_type:complete